MDYYDMDTLAGLNTSEGNESLMRQQLRLREREADLKDQMRTARAAGAPQGQIVGNGGFQHYVAPSWQQQLSPIAAQIAGEVQKRALQADQTGYDKAEMDAVRKHLATAPPEDAPQAIKLLWAEKGAQLPSIRAAMQDYAKDQLVNAPERQAQRDARKDLATQSQAEKAAAQQRELDYRRERDTSTEQMRRDLAGDSNDLRRSLAAAVRSASGGGGGDKASNYQIVQDAQGNASRVNKLTGDVTPLGGIGREAAGITKERQEQGEKVSNAKKALSDLDEAELLLPKATGSAVGSLRDTIAGAAGFSTENAKAAARLDQISSTLAGQVPRLGGATSDRDLVFYKEQVGNLGDRSKPVDTRLAALKQVRKFMQRAADPSSYASPTGQPSSNASGPSIRDAVKAATQPVSDDALLYKYLK